MSLLKKENSIHYRWGVLNRVFKEPFLTSASTERIKDIYLQTELRSKIETDSDREQVDRSGVGRGAEGSNKKEKGLTTMDNSVAIVGSRGVGRGGSGYKGDKW